MIIGIDLGTSNSLVAYWDTNTSKIIPNTLGNNLTPSVVGLDDEGQLLVGQVAKERLITHPDRTVAAFKRYMGSTRLTKLGDKTFRPEELSACVLRSLKADAERHLGQTITEAIITVPAYFNDTQRKATKIAGELAGLSDVRLLNEPTAAALAYSIHTEQKESKFLVFDLGGGTFDVSILELFEGVIEVCASTGDNFLGGEDFVDILINAFVDNVGAAAGMPKSHRPAALEQKLRWEADHVKRLLTTQESAEMRIQWSNDGQSPPNSELVWKITQQDFATLCNPLLARLRSPLERALRDARIRTSELSNVVLAGGATRMPMIRRMVATLFGRLPASTLNPDEVVALGAATQAGLKMRSSALGEIVLVDVCPYSLGVEISQMTSNQSRIGGVFLPIIERNTVIPASRVDTLNTVNDYQRSVDVNVYQGESQLVKDNILLGKLSIPVPAKRKGEVTLDVRFTYDVNGLLEVDVNVPLSKERKTLVIEGNPGVLSKAEIEQSLKKLSQLKVHPLEQAPNQAVIARAERMYEQTLGHVRALLGERLVLFRGILERQNPSDIEAARKELETLLDQIDNDRYL